MMNKAERFRYFPLFLVGKSKTRKKDFDYLLFCCIIEIRKKQRGFKNGRALCK